MAESSIIQLGTDNNDFDISYWCPTTFKEVGIPFTGGIDSTALMCMLLSVYPPDSIRIFHINHYATPAMHKMASRLGINNITIVPAAKSSESIIEEICSFAFNNTKIDAIYLPLDESQVLGNESIYFNIGIRVPFSHFNKQHTIDLIYKLNCGSILRECHSCEQKESVIDWQHCGECNQCKERIKGFKLLGIEDPTIYKNKEK